MLRDWPQGVACRLHALRAGDVRPDELDAAMAVLRRYTERLQEPLPPLQGLVLVSAVRPWAGLKRHCSNGWGHGC